MVSHAKLARNFPDVSKMVGENIMIINQNAEPLPAAFRGSDAAVIVPLLLRATTSDVLPVKSSYVVLYPKDARYATVLLSYPMIPNESSFHSIGHPAQLVMPSRMMGALFGCQLLIDIMVELLQRCRDNPTPTS